MKNYHLLGTTHWDQIALKSREEYADLWRRLRTQFPQVIACCLMPDHVHLAVETLDPVAANQRLALILHAHTRAHHPNKKSVWGPMTPPELFANGLHRSRMIRYLHLNPCRAGYVRDPLTWEWSTHREAMGAVVPAWMNLTSIIPAEFHAYVSSDSSVAVAGTPVPSAKRDLAASLEGMSQAVLMATRSTSLRHRGSPRKLFVHLARKVGAPSTQALATYVGISRRAACAWANRELTSIERQQLAAAWLTLSDPRLSRFQK